MRWPGCPGRWNPGRSRRCWPRATRPPRPGGGTGRSCCCCPGWACGPAKSPGLGLDDIDWRRGEITVRGKGGRRDRLPLPADVGAAIVAYLRDGRPAGALDRTVFIAAQAPREALSYTGITTIVAEAAARAGIPGPVHAHRLRHSAATAMLRGGGSLTEIGQALRHARPATTAIYAKVDTGALRPLGRPWPGQEESA